MNLNRLAFLAAAALLGVAAPSISTAQDAAARNLILRSGNTTAANVGTLGVTTLTAPRSYTFPDKDGSILVTPAAMSPLSVLRTNAAGDIETVALTDGQLLIGATGGLPTAATLTGTTNQVTVTNGTNSITLSLPQDIHTGASPTFYGLTITDGPIALTTTGTNNITITPAGELKLVGITSLSPITDLLWIDASNNVRRAPFTGTANEGVQFETSAYRLGVSAGTDADPWNNNAFTTDRYVNLNTFDLFFTTANANNRLLTLTGDATNGAVTLASFGTGDVTLAASDEISFATAGSERMVLEADGDLGIGIATAIAPLHVSRAVSAGTMDVLLMNGAAAGTLNNAVQITFANDNGATPALPNAFIRSENTGGANNAATLSFGTWDGAASATRMSIAPNGNVTVAGTVTINDAGGNDLTLSETTISRVGNIAINPGTGNDITTDGGITSAENVTITSGGLTVNAGGANITGATTIATGVNELTVTGLAADNTLTSMLTLNGSDQVRTTALNDVAWLVGGNTFTAAGTYTVGTNSAHDFALESGGSQLLTLSSTSPLGTAAMNIVPFADNTYDLGSDANRWQDVYVNGTSLHIGPANGQSGNTELAIGYAASNATFNVNGGVAELNLGIGTATVGGTLTINNAGGNDLTLDETTISRTGNIAINPGTGNDITTDGGITSAENVTITSGGLTVNAGGAGITGTTSINTTAAANTTTIGNNTAGNTLTVNSPSVTLANLPAGTGDVFVMSNAGALETRTISNIVTGTGTNGRMTRWGAGNTLQDASLDDNGSGVLSRAGSIQLNPGSGNTLSTDGSLTVAVTTTLNGAVNAGNGDDNVNINAGTGTFQLSSTGLNVTTAGVISDAGGDVEMADHLVPSADATYDLGTDAIRWANAYIAGASLHIGPSGGTAGGTELAVGYAASTANLNANGGTTELALGTDAVTVLGTTKINETGAAGTTIGNAAAGAVGITSGANMTLTASSGTLTATGSQVTIDAGTGNTVAIGGTNAGTLTLGNTATATTVTGTTLAANTATSIILTNNVAGDVGTLNMIGGSVGLSHDNGTGNESNLAISANSFSLSEQDATTLLSSSVSGGGGAVTIAADDGTNQGSIDINATISGEITIAAPLVRLSVSTGVYSEGAITIDGASPLVLEGVSVDATATTISVTDPTAANTITIPDASGVMSIGNSGRVLITDDGTSTIVTYTINDVNVTAGSVITVTLEDGTDNGFQVVKVGNRVNATSFDVTLSAALGAGQTKYVNYTISNQ